MMFTKTEIAVLELFASRILDSFTIRETARLIKKDLKIVHTSIKSLIIKDFVVKEKRALKLNYKKHGVDLAYVENIRKENLFEKNRNIKIYTAKFLEKTKNKFFILLIFGSWASGKAGKKSDVDLLAVLPKEDELFERQLKAVLSSADQDFHINVIDVESFKEMLGKRDEMNVVNETLNNHILIYGAELYYGLLGERDVK